MSAKGSVGAFAEYGPRAVIGVREIGPGSTAIGGVDARLRRRSITASFSGRPGSWIRTSLDPSEIATDDPSTSTIDTGRMLRPDSPLLPNYKHMPIGYHGRASSVVASGAPIQRPSGQRKPSSETEPSFGPSRYLDYELEFAVFIGRGNARGTAIPIGEAEEHIAGLCLLNDWSARDIQAWEYQPLGPFLAKSFATTISPWIVTLEALEPFRCPAFARAADDPRPLPYLFSERDEREGGLAIGLEMYLRTAQMKENRSPAMRLSRGSSRDAYWTPAQMVAHHSSNGCNLRPGDLLGSGTLSGPAPENAGSMMELTQAGRNPLSLPGGETRAFLADGDEVIQRGRCEREGATPIGFGEAAGRARPAP
jgi:fumarylacetoacetase